MGVGVLETRGMTEKGQGMKQWLGMVSLLLPVLMAGCAPQDEVHALRTNTVALERQSSAQRQAVDARVQQLSDRLTQVEQAQAATRRDIAQVAATLDEFRGHLQRLRGAIQETEHQTQRSTTEADGASATRLTNVESRLRALAKRLAVAPE